MEASCCRVAGKSAFNFSARPICRLAAAAFSSVSKRSLRLELSALCKGWTRPAQMPTTSANSRKTSPSIFLRCGAEFLVMTQDPFRVTAFDSEEGKRFGWVQRIDLPRQAVFQNNRVLFAQAIHEVGQGGDALDEFFFRVGIREVFRRNGQ